MKKNPKRIGEAGEAAFLYKATRLGFSVSKPFGDSDPYDFIVDNGRRLLKLQVKTSGFRFTGGFQCSVRHGYKEEPYRKRDFDFLALWIQPLDIWYVIPVEEIFEHYNVCVYPQTRSSTGRYEQYRDAWHLLLRKRFTRTRTRQRQQTVENASD